MKTHFLTFLTLLALTFCMSCSEDVVEPDVLPIEEPIVEIPEWVGVYEAVHPFPMYDGANILYVGMTLTADSMFVTRELHSVVYGELYVNGYINDDIITVVENYSSSDGEVSYDIEFNFDEVNPSPIYLDASYFILPKTLCDNLENDPDYANFDGLQDVYDIIKSGEFERVRFHKIEE